MKTVNHRFLDILFKMPRELYRLESLLKREIQSRIKRGRVELFITIKGEGLSDQAIQVDWNLLNQYIKQVDHIQRETKISGHLSLDHLFQLEDIFYTEESEAVDDELTNMLKDGLNQVIDQVNEMRTREGDNLVSDLVSHLNALKDWAKNVEAVSEENKNEQFEKLKNKLSNFLSQEQGSEERIVQEAAILVEKSDISEELTRLYSHIDQFFETLELDVPIGRKLDFITQELLREVNTIASKTTIVDVSQSIVEMKSEIEKMKEQVQNIE